MACRDWWRNCGVEPDAEMLEIDRMEDALSPLPANVSKIRQLISTLEMCHHKAERWVSNIIEAIGSGQTDKGLGTRTSNQLHPVEQTWQEAVTALREWCEGNSASKYSVLIGKRSPLKEWQVQRTAEKIKSFVHWPSTNDISERYTGMLESFSDGYASTPNNECPEKYKDHEDFWTATTQTMIQNKVNGNVEDVSLAYAIDLLMPCHWNFAENLEIVLGAIGGNISLDKPCIICGLMPKLNPLRPRMKVVSDTLRHFWRDTKTRSIDIDLYACLGEPTNVKKWLAASLDKTIRLHLEL